MNYADDPNVEGLLEQIAEMATLAGIKGEVDWARQVFVAMFGFEGGRSQGVLAQPIGTDRGPGVCVFSAAAAYPKSFFGKLTRDDAINLLRLNDRLVFARYGIRETDSEILVVASVDLVLETLEPEELSLAMTSVARAADMWEQTTGRDDF